jgi:outer membrane scaffolding protein for murein synthesis (MipA/OmpV family)
MSTAPLQACAWFSLTLACAGALAQSPVTMMPEGTKSVSVGVALGSTPRAEGSRARSTFLVPHFSVLWSNGVFIEGLSLGLHLSRTPHLQYGPKLFFDMGAQRADHFGGRGKKRLVPGAFLNYQPFSRVSLNSSFHYGATPEGDGVLASASAHYFFPVAERQSVRFGAGLRWGSTDYMQSYFSVSEQQASAGKGQLHEAHAGIKEVFMTGSWRWQVSRKITLDNYVSWSQLRGGAAASPVIDSPKAVTYYTSMSYRF